MACRECRQRRFARASLLGRKGDEYGVAHSVKFEGKKMMIRRADAMGCLRTKIADRQAHHRHAWVGERNSGMM